MEALMGEVRKKAEGCREDTVVSAFLGGGTPSLADPDQIERLLEAVHGHYRVAPDAEITIEVNPGTADREKLKAYQKAGINRLSIGLQSADDEELAALGRIHTWRQFLDIYREAREAGFVNINVDVMSALPGQSLESCLKTLEKVLDLEPAPEHISAYSLILEEGTPFFEMASAGELQLPDEELDRLMYRETGRMLGEAGYRRYEISNYAREGHECRHNKGYWTRKNYLGFGLGAASLYNNMRYKNTGSMTEYLRDPLGSREEMQRLSREEQMEEFMFLGLRLTEGVSLERFRRVFGVALEEIYGPAVERSVKDGLLYRYSRPAKNGKEDMLALTELGLDVSNYCLARFLL